MLSITNWFYMQINLLKNSNMKIDVRQKSDNTETDTVLSDKFNKRREQLRYETYKERTKLGLIGPTQTF